MKKNKKRKDYDPEWARATTLCRLSAEDVRKAKELGFKPRSLIKNNPSPSQRWKQPVKLWVRDLYARKFPHKVAQGRRPPPSSRSAPPAMVEDDERAFDDSWLPAEDGPRPPSSTPGDEDDDIPF